LLPPIEFVDGKTLSGGHGAYDTQSGVVYLNSDLRNNHSLLAQAFVEEAGHHLEAQRNKSDGLGDEGKLFCCLISGEKLSRAQIKSARQSNGDDVSSSHSLVPITDRIRPIIVRMNNSLRVLCWQKMHAAVGVGMSSFVDLLCFG
jgi:hypothetical protein